MRQFNSRLPTNCRANLEFALRATCSVWLSGGEKLANRCAGLSFVPLAQQGANRARAHKLGKHCRRSSCLVKSRPANLETTRKVARQSGSCTSSSLCAGNYLQKRSECDCQHCASDNNELAADLIGVRMRPRQKEFGVITTARQQDMLVVVVKTGLTTKKVATEIMRFC